MDFKYTCPIFFTLVLCWADEEKVTLLSRKLRSIVYPEGAAMGIFLALQVPFELPGRSVSLSYNYEANYKLPYNGTMFTNPLLYREESEERSKRSLDRRRAYIILESKFESKGFSGRQCLLRTVCEAAETPLGHNGLIGDLMHILFTPSTTRNRKLHPSFEEAELLGLSGADCRKEYPECPVGLFDLISIFDW